MAIKAKLVVCCDGTSNSEYLGEEKSPLTNVSRISRAIRQSHTDGCRQIVLYNPGIGTDESNPLNDMNQGLGVGLNSQIKEAYTFLCHNYCEETNDDIILIGFSRGAFAVRCLVDFILKKGLLYKENLHHLPRLFNEWMDPPAIDALVIEPEPRKPHIRVCALWDTVNSIGFPRPWPFGRGRPKLGFVDSHLRDGVEHAFQAVSLFEHRFHFHPIVLRKTQEGTCRLQQCWFSGYHGDIGGGNSKEALAHFALAWMIIRLRTFLTIDETAFWYRKDGLPTWVLPDDLEIPDSYYSWWGWKAAGSSHRTPRIDFWNANGIYHEDVTQLPQDHNAVADFSMEKMHSSVRFMAQRNYLVNHFNKCQSLKGKLLKEQEDRWVWVLHVSQAVIQWWKKMGHWLFRTRPDGTPYNVWEDEVNNDEQNMLITWAEDEQDLLLGDETTEPGAAPPNTIIVPFKAWVVDPLRNANQVEVAMTLPLTG